MELGGSEPVGDGHRDVVVGFLQFLVDELGVEFAHLVAVVVVGEGVDHGAGRDVDVGQGSGAEVPERFVVLVLQRVFCVLGDGRGEPVPGVANCSEDGVRHHPEVLDSFDGVAVAPSGGI